MIATLRIFHLTFVPLFALLLFQKAPISKTQVTTAKVIAIADGDTFSVLDGKTTIRVRIDAIDAPEKGMPYYKVSKQYLSRLCFGKTVTVTRSTTDRYGRMVARVRLSDGRDISEQMLIAGMAWHYKSYSKDRKLAAFEDYARKKRLGLWKDAKPIAPWEIRKLHRKGISTKAYFKDRVE